MQYEHMSLEGTGRRMYGQSGEVYRPEMTYSAEKYAAQQGLDLGIQFSMAGLDSLVLMPDKDGTGPKGNGKRDGSGCGKGGCYTWNNLIRDRSFIQCQHL